MIHAYWFEGDPQFGERVLDIYQAMERRNDILCGSSYVLGELLVKPHSVRNQNLVEGMITFFTSPFVILLDYPPQAARTFAMLRADFGLKSFDALHLAIATTGGVDLFLTNDRRLHKVVIPNLPFIATLETDLF